MVRYLFVLASALFCVSCGGDESRDGDSPATADAGMSPSGGEDGSPDTFVAGLERTGSAGVFSIRLTDSVPTPRDTGLYTWTIELIDGDGQPVSGATIQAEPTMPAHGHGTNPKYTDATETAAPGSYELIEMDLFMEGVWNVMIRVSTDDDRQDQIEYNFYLEG